MPLSLPARGTERCAWRALHDLHPAL